MKTKKILEKLQALMDPEKRADDAKQERMRELLKKLKKKQRKVEADLDATTEREERKLLERELDVIREQRKKGIRACRKMGCH